MSLKLYRHVDSLPPAERGRSVTIGAFDGLHLGHRVILDRLMQDARAAGRPALVCSFEPTPGEVLSPHDPPPRLTCFRERFELLDAAGIDEFFCPSFRKLRRLTPQEFVERLLVERLDARHVVVGHDFRFGYGRGGTLDDLRRAGERHGFDVTVVEPVMLDGERVSSTAIRAALAAGDLEKAKSMLGRDYSMSGRVIRGLGLGKRLGFPTANIGLKRRRAPVDGIFAVRVGGLGPKLLDGVASIGTRPTVGGGPTLLEVLIFDFDREVYGEHITVHFVKRLREERHFDGLEALKAQIAVDVGEARAALRRAAPAA
ncbi:MAG: bifunctional riboflavin kinase/FAD synthetase [Gammaproteobacteria bacterium]|nr:bifunctional riboflavin kinase/FAD synthetase [Gammaproteobacteria bacterium]